MEWREGGENYSEELHDLHTSPFIIRIYEVEEDEFGGACSANGERRKVCRLFVGKP
jgi:hypothetical protein